MDFAISKENIQPLRGGRNAVQLEVGLQAQHNPQVQETLMQQKQQYETEICNYTGEDPLENYYRYIFWVEQSFPKHGHEGNFISLLENCLEIFENNPNYQNDHRFCKLWIKYIDLQPNHTELYKMLYTKRIGIGFADFYKAWAFYFEADGDYKRADQVYKLGKAELAQPFQELQTAHHNFVYNAGFHMLNDGAADMQRLAEQRQALTELQTFRPGQVDSERVPFSGTGGNSLSVFRNENRQRNAPLNVFEEYQDILVGAGAPPASILSLVKIGARQENTLRAGSWIGVTKKTQTVHKTSSIPVHVDSPVAPHERGMQLPAGHLQHTKEDFTLWNVPLYLIEPTNPSQIPMYCKSLVYGEANKEYSLEEIRARRYRKKRDVSRESFSMETMEVSGVNQSHTLSNSQSPMQSEALTRPSPYATPQQQLQPQPHASSMHPPYSPHVSAQYIQHSPHPHSMDVHGQPHYAVHSGAPSHFGNSPMQPPLRHPNLYRHVVPYNQQQSTVSQHSSQPHEAINNGQTMPMLHEPQHAVENVHYAPYQPLHQPHALSSYNESKSYETLGLQPLAESGASYHTANSHLDARQMPAPVCESPSPNPDFPWMMTNAGDVPPVRAQPLTHFSVYVDSSQTSSWHPPPMEAKGNAMKTPIKTLSDDELAETGSRGGLDAAAAAQPTDGAKRVYEDEDSIAGSTEMFNLNAMHVSTPQNKINDVNAVRFDEAKSTKKRLFCGLPDITEESNYLSSASSGSSSTTGPRVFSVSRPTAMAPINEQSNYHFNLLQNMKANAELRSKVGMDCESGPESPDVRTSQPPAYDNFYSKEQPDPGPKCIANDDEAQKHVPYSVLNIQPSDPFTNTLIEKFLAHVKFPGRHHRSYKRINGVPKLAIKKDPCHVGQDRFIVEKLLGKGSYGSVYKATRCDTGAVVALKLQKPPNKWEYYICKEIHARLAEHPLRECFMDVQVGYFSEQASVLLSDVHNCSLLDLINSIKVQLPNSPKHHLSIHLTSEMMKIVQALHQVQIVHADIKPDNFLVVVRRDVVRLQLIDFGCSIDMSLLPPGTSFTRKVKTDSFQCCEMKDDRSWNYHTDLFCIAATAHVLLLENYIEVKNLDNRWYIAKKIPRYYRDELWSVFFNCMLNMQEGLADLDFLIAMFANALDHNVLRSATTHIINSFKNR